MTDRKLLAEYKLWTRDGWASGGSRKTRASARTSSTPMTPRQAQPKKPKPSPAASAMSVAAAKKPKASPNKRASTAARLAAQLVGSAATKTKAARVVEKLDLGGWIDDNWAAPLGVKRPRKPVARLNISRQLPPQWLSKGEAPPPPPPPARAKAAAAAATQPRKKRGVSSKWDAVPPEVKSDTEEEAEDTAEEPAMQNYASLHDEPDTLTYQGRKVRVDWDELLDFLSSKGWRTEKKSILGGAEATLYFVGKGRRKEDGGKLGQDYFLSHEGVLHYLELHEEIMQDFFDY